MLTLWLNFEMLVGLPGGGKMAIQRFIGSGLMIALAFITTAAAPQTGKPPEFSDIQVIHARAVEKYKGTPIVREVKGWTQSGFNGLANPFGGYLAYQSKEVNNLKCKKLNSTVFSCSYDLTVKVIPDADSAMGTLMASNVPPTTSHHTDIIRKISGSWASADVDATWERSAREASQRQTSRSIRDCGMHRDYSDLSTVAPKYSYSCEDH